MPDRQTSMNVSLPAPMRSFIRRRMKDGGFGNASEYVRHLVREDSKSAARERLQELLREGWESGSAGEVTPEFWADLRERVQARASASRRTKKAG